MGVTVRPAAVASTKIWGWATLAAVALAFTYAQADDLRVISGGAAQQVLQTLAPRFESTTGSKVDLSFAVVGVIQQKLTAGEKADVLLLPVPLLDALEKGGAFRSRSRTALGRVAIGVVVREGASVPDISTSDAVRKALLQARSVAFPDPKVTPSGSHLMRVFAQMGIADAMQPKVTFRNAIDGGVHLVRDGQVEIGLFLVTEVLPVKGIKLVGTLPPALQGYVVYGAAVAADSGAPEKASELVRFLSDPSLREHWKAAGFELPGGGN
jgi:molybdate transport system substrate-binding protein